MSRRGGKGWRSTTAMLLPFWAVLFWGWSFVATKVLLRYLTPLEVIAARMLLGAPILLLIVRLKGMTLRFTRRDRLTIVAAGLILAAHLLLQAIGLGFTTATHTGWLIAVTPLPLALLSRIWLQESFGRRQVLGVTLATIGVLLLVSNGRPEALGWLSGRGDWLILISCGTWACYTVATRNISRRHPPVAVVTVIVCLVAPLAIIAVAATSDPRVWVTLPRDGWIAAIFLGVFCLALAYWFWQEGVARLGAARAGYFLYLEPLFTTVLAVPYLGETYGLPAAVGGALVLGGVFVSQRRPARIGDPRIISARQRARGSTAT